MTVGSGPARQGAKTPGTGWEARLLSRVVNQLLGRRSGRRAVRAAVSLARWMPGRGGMPRTAGTTADPARRVFGGVAKAVLFENERVRVWEMRLAPGESSALHEHQHDYVIVQIAGDRIAAVIEPDSTDALGLAGKRLETAVHPGLAVFVPRGGRETAVNPGEQPYHEVLIELKD